MGEKVKNILIAVVGVIVLVILFRLAWTLAGFVLKLIFSVLIFLLLVGLIVYFVQQWRRRG